MRFGLKLGAVAAIVVGLLPGCSSVVQQIENDRTAIRLTDSCRDQTSAGRLETALRMCNEAIDISPSAESYYYRAAVNVRAGQPAQALPDVDEAIRLNPRYQDAYELRAYLHMYAREYAFALKDADSLVNLTPNYPQGYGLRCEIYDKMGDYGAARRQCDLAEQAPMDRANALLKTSYFEATHADWQRALRGADLTVTMVPRAGVAWNNRCWIKIRMNDIESAKADCAQALRLSHNAAYIRDTRGDIWFRMRKFSADIADEDSEIAASPNLPYGYGGRCAAETEEHLLQKAMRDCARAISLDQDYNGYWYMLRGNVYRAQRDFKRARADYERAEAAPPLPIEVFREESWLAIDEHEFSDSARLAQRYIALNPYDPVGHEAFGRALTELGEPGQARSQFDRALAGYAKRSDSDSIARVKAAESGLR